MNYQYCILFKYYYYYNNKYNVIKYVILKNFRDKKFGLSKEGSGRVAVLKYTGLIRSYTLECNYNTSRFVNFIPPMVHFVSEKRPIQSFIPPKFTPTIFEQVKRCKVKHSGQNIKLVLFSV